MKSRSGTYPFAKWLVQTLIVAVANAVTGSLALLLAVPPGFASPIFPPAGISLAAMLLCGYRLAPGVFLGSLALNSFQLYLWPHAESSLTQSAIVVATIAAGSTLQAFAGAWLIRKMIPSSMRLINERDIIWFLTLGGPVSCLIAATVGIGTLYYSGRCLEGDALFNWINWYSGDALGILIVTPILFVLCGQPRDFWGGQRWIFVALPLVLMAAAATAVFNYSAYREETNADLVFQRRTEELAQEIRRAFRGHIEVLESIRSFYDSAIEVDRLEFHTFVKSAFDRHAGIQALEWAPHIAGRKKEETDLDADAEASDALKSLVEKVRQDAGKFPQLEVSAALSSFAVNQAQNGNLAVLDDRGEREHFFPVLFVEPYKGNEEALGLDLYSERNRCDAIRKAYAQREAVATRPVDLVQKAQGKNGVLIFMPVFVENDADDSAADRYADLEGMAVGVFLVERTIDMALENRRHSDMNIRITDRASAGQAIDEKQIYGPPIATTTMHLGLPSAERTFKFASRDWKIHFTASPEFVTELRGWQAWAMPIGALLLIGLFSTFVLVSTGRNLEVSNMVQDQTHELRVKTEALEASNTQLARTNDKLAEINKELARSNKELQDFAFVASHDLQEPLRAITSFSQLIEEKFGDQFDEEAREYFDFIVDGGRRMQELLMGLLAFSRVRTRGLPMEMTDSNTAFEDAVYNLLTFIAEEGAEVTKSDLPTVRADPSQLVQVIQNLISNAVRYRKADVPVHVHVDAVDENGEWLFSVSDNGIGIEKEHLDRIFVIFQRLHTRAEFAGTGIGLAITKRIIERHHGRIWAESELGKGSTFYFTLPKEQPTRS